jgi:hypothetical protein
MLATTGAYQTMQESLDLVPDYRVTITLPGGVYPDLTLGVKSLEINCSTTSDLPDQSRFQVGYPAMECTFTLAGLVDQRDETKTAAWLFGKYPTTASDGTCRRCTSSSWNSPRHGRPRVAARRDGGRVRAAAEVHRLRRLLPGEPRRDGRLHLHRLPVAVEVAPNIPAVVTAPPYNAGLTSEYAVDALLRKATSSAISTWPAQAPELRPRRRAAASLWPEVGSLVTSAAQPVPHVRSPASTAPGLAQASPPAGGLANITWQTTAALGTTVFVEFWVTGVFFPPFIGIHDAGSLIAGVPLLTCLQVSTTGPTGDTERAHARRADVHPQRRPSTPPPTTSRSSSPSPPRAERRGQRPSTSTARRRRRGDELHHPSRGAAWNMVTAVPQTATIEGVQVTTESAPTVNNGFSPKPRCSTRR